MGQNRWFVAVILLQSRVGAWDDGPIVDHQVRILAAPDPDAAFDSAMQVGHSAEHDYKNADGESVAWEFLGLSELEELGASVPKSGDEIFSWRTPGPGRELVKEKAQLAVFANARNAQRTARELLDQ